MHKYEEIISKENLLLAWREFEKGKKNKEDVLKFSIRLMDNILSLHNDLSNKTYKHGFYQHFKINDPKPRDIHKATVRDRLLHHAIYRILYPYFDKKFICDSYSCRINKGTHKAINRFRYFAGKVSKNNTKTCWVLKCDIRKFFANIAHQILVEILQKYIEDEDILWLLGEAVGSLNTNQGKTFHSIIRRSFGNRVKCFIGGKGLPLGNLTSQLLVNIYMNEFDQFMKHKLKQKYYIRYSDDFVMLSDNKKELEEMLPKINKFLKDKLRLELHPDKVFIKTYSSGVDFLGWVNFLNHRVLRTSTKRRMLKRVKINPKEETINSYLGLLRHGNGYELRKKVVENFLLSSK